LEKAAVNALTFGSALWLWALLALPLLAFLFVRAEWRGAQRLGQFVAPRLLPQLGAAVNRTRRMLRFGLILLGIALAIVSLAKPRWGYTYEELKRRGLDLIVAVDTSRSMLANDIPPNRLQRVKLAVQDLLTELKGDRVGIIAFAGRAFLQAPLTIDYEAAAEALNDLDTETIPEGGTNISEAIAVATRTFGKSAMGNRALIIFTDGEELQGDALKVAQTAADAGVRIFTIGVGTPEGSLIPLPSQMGGSTFVKDPNGQVVKSKLDEKRLREIAELTGGVFLPLGNGPATMRQLYTDGLAQLQTGEIDARISRQPIERYQWPLGAAILALATSMLISERGRQRATAPRATRRTPARAAVAALLVLLASTVCAHAAAPGLDAYRNEQYAKAYEEFQQTLQKHPNSRATDKIQFDAGAAAYKMKDYNKALQAFSQALLSPDQQLQARSHYNLGNTLYQRGETQKTPEQKLKDWTNALQHYEQTLKHEPEDKQAKENSEYVQKKLEELKQQQEQQPSPTPSPSPNQQDKKDQKQDQKDKSGGGDQKKQDQNQDQKDQQQDQQSGDEQQQQPGESPSPSPQQGSSPSPRPSPDPGCERQPQPERG
jgi:Ca-activated chloride channel family protein